MLTTLPTPLKVSLHQKPLAQIAFIAGAVLGCLTQSACSLAPTAPSIAWVSSTPSAQWQSLPATALTATPPTGANVVKLDPQTTYQPIDGFGGCFNELAWSAVQSLDAPLQAEVLKSLFAESGCNFNLCRVGIGANDFALEWYSLDETPGDFAMTNFSIERDRKILIPYIKAAMQYQPKLAVWGVPWSPPSWMKTNNQYQGGAMKQDAPTLAAYALYFSKYVQAYREAGVNLYAIHPQNEPTYNNGNYPQCHWTGAELNTFLRDYLLPQLKKDRVNVQVWLGTIVSGKLPEYVDPVLGDAVTGPQISGIGYQYGGQPAFLATHQKYPGLKMLQTETECYKGENSWTQAQTTFSKMINDLNNFANGYTFWNMILSEKSTSSWGWKQNSLVQIDTQNKKITYEPEFYSLKHFSHFVHPGATRISATGQSDLTGTANPFTTSNLIAFRNPSGELVVILRNPGNDPLPVTLQSGNSSSNVTLPAQSMNTLVLSGW